MGLGTFWMVGLGPNSQLGWAGPLVTIFISQSGMAGSG